MANGEKPEVKEGELIAASDFLPIVRYERGDEIRTYNVLVVENGAELWAVTEAFNKVPRTVKEGLFTKAGEALEFLEEVNRTLLAVGWRKVQDA
jgi:hypothetical protein